MENININDISMGEKRLTVFMAPPGWGKTSLLLDLYKSGNKKLIFVSPLRALANEFFERLKKARFEGCSLVQSYADVKPLFRKFLLEKKGVLVVTPELISSIISNELEGLKLEDVLIVLDEFHLFFYWGLDFRPVMWEVFMEASNSGFPILALSATFDQSLINFFISGFKKFLDFEKIIFINLGNQRLKNMPSRIFLFPPKKIPFFKNMLKRRLIRTLRLKVNGIILVFCYRRNEVDVLVKELNALGFNVLGCKGGEVGSFLEQFYKVKDLHCICTTSALSHGVNLGTVRGVFFTYPVKNKDLWFQMVGRGGRTGEDFEVFGFNSFLGKQNSFLYFVRAIVMDLFIFLLAFVRVRKR
tara:strand:+ start:939 stop:2009 length:1071 start_codon:yes stop_codon:yes gene_type:complete